MKTIYKFTLDEMDISFRLAITAKILKCGVQENKVVMWAEVDTLNCAGHRRFVVVGTGWDMSHRDDSWRYVDTVQMTNGLVWHIYEIT